MRIFYFCLYIMIFFVHTLYAQIDLDSYINGKKLFNEGDYCRAYEVLRIFEENFHDKTKLPSDLNEWLDKANNHCKNKDKNSNDNTPQTIKPPKIIVIRDTIKIKDTIEVENDYIVSDELGIMIQKADILSYEKAEEFCKNFRLGNFSDWRLPTIKELDMIFSNKRILNINLENDSENWYWGFTDNKIPYTLVRRNRKKKTPIPTFYYEREQMNLSNGSKQRVINGIGKCICVRTFP